jgi:hypothetical protein
MDLKNYQIPLSVGEGLFYLETLNQTTHILGIYQHYFPQEWQIASQQIKTNEIFNLVQQFFSLVDQNLFPLILEEIESDLGDYLTTIPYYPCGWDWYIESRDDWTDAELFLLCLNHNNLVQQLAEKGENLPDFPQFPEQSLDDFDSEQFEAFCQNYPPPLSYLANVMMLISHATGTIWLDSLAEEYYPLDWTRDNVELLTEQWQIASTFISQKQELCHWLSLSPQHYQQVIQLLENAF